MYEYEYEWSHEPILLPFVNSGERLSFVIFVERIEIDPMTTEEISRTKMEVTYEQIIDEEQGLEEFPDSIDVDVSNEVDISGRIEAQAPFIDRAYSVDGESREVDTVQEIPFGAKVHKLIPSSDEYKYYKWRIYSVDEVNNEPLAERTFTLTVRISWDEANKTIKRLASEIER